MMSAAENAAARIDADLYFPAHVKTLYPKFTVVPGEKIDGHDTYLVIGRNEGQPPLRLYFDQQSGLLLRLVRYAETALGRMPTQIDYADYRDAGRRKDSLSLDACPPRQPLHHSDRRSPTKRPRRRRQVHAPAPPPPPPPDKKPAGQ